MHKLLERLLAKHFAHAKEVPATLQPFLRAVDEALTQADRDRALVERSLDLASDELLARNEALDAQVRREREAREGLRKSEENYRRIVETATEGIWILDTKQRTSFVNERMAQMLGYSREELAKRSLLDVLAGESRDAAMQALVGRTDRVEGQRDVQMRRRDGSLLWALVSSTPILDDQGHYAGALGMVTDITARKIAEEAIRDAYARLKEMDEARARFINAAAHELSTPLTPLKLQVQVIKGRVHDDPKQSRSVEILERSVGRLEGLVRDLLDSSRLQSGTLALQKEPADLCEIARTAAGSFEEAARELGISFELRNPVALPVRCDPTRVGQVVENLLSNALKFTRPGGKITLAAHIQDDQPTVSVTDTGIGIEPARVQRLFQPFVQVHEPWPGMPAGTGLGLFICKGIIEASGGHIWVRSAGPGKGTTVGFHLPPATPAGDEDE